MMYDKIIDKEVNNSKCPQGNFSSMLKAIENSRKGRIVTIESLAESVAERWRDTYWDATDKCWRHTERAEEIYNLLLEIRDEDHISERIQQIGKIIGNFTWTNLTCSCCQLDKCSNMFRWGDGYDSVTICFACTETASRLLDKEFLEKHEGYTPLRVLWEKYKLDYRDFC